VLSARILVTKKSPFVTNSVDGNTPGQVKLVAPANPAHNPPVFGGIARTSSNLTLNGSGGISNGTYYVLNQVVAH
jgi:hypothetical protein